MKGPPLLGRTVVVTRAAQQAPVLVELLRRAGARTVELPAIRIEDPADAGQGLRSAADRLESYEWVVFTSANTVERFAPLLGDPPRLAPVRAAAIGPGTAAALRRRGLPVHLVPERFVAESLLAAFPPPSGRRRVLLPRAAAARDVLPEGLRSAGWVVDVVEAYRTEPATPGPEALEAAGRADAITFTSPSTVRSYVELAGPGRAPPVVACIGPITADAAREANLEVDVVADVHTIQGLVAALAGHFSAVG